MSTKKLELVKIGGAVRKQLEKAGGRIIHLDYQAGQRTKGITTWLRPVAKGSDDGIAWLAANADKVVEKDGKKMIDLMTLTYEELPPGWQAANDDAAKFAVDIICLIYIGAGGQLSASLRDDLARFVHMNWVMKQLSWSREEEGVLPDMFKTGQQRDFVELTKAEQEKDQSIVTLIEAELERLLRAA